MNLIDVGLFLLALLLSTALMSETTSYSSTTMERNRGMDPFSGTVGSDSFDEWIDVFDFAQESERAATSRRAQRRTSFADAVADDGSASEAWVMLLDGDDKPGHYGRAAYAHTRALMAHGGGRPVLVLIRKRQAGLSDQVVARLKDAGATIQYVDDLAPIAKKSRLIKHVNKIYVWSLIQYVKVVFIDLDMVLLRPWLLSDLLFQYPGSPPTFNVNFEREDRFNSGIMVVTPSTVQFERLTRAILPDFKAAWDATDQSLVHAAFPEFGRLPAFVCPKKRLRYTDPELWAALTGGAHTRGPANGTAAVPSPFVAPPLACVHWTGEKPWQFQKRADLQALTILWHRYMAYWGQQTAIPSADYQAARYKRLLKKTRRKKKP